MGRDTNSISMESEAGIWNLADVYLLQMSPQWTGGCWSAHPGPLESQIKHMLIALQDSGAYAVVC